MPTLDQLRDVMANVPVPKNLPTGQDVVRLAKRRRNMAAGAAVAAVAIAAVGAVPVSQSIFGGNQGTVPATSTSFQPDVALPGIVSPGPSVPTTAAQAEKFTGKPPNDPQPLPSVAQAAPKVNIGVDDITVWMEPAASAGAAPQLCFDGPDEAPTAECRVVDQLRQQQRPGIGVWIADFPVSPKHFDMRFNILRGPVASVVYTLNGEQKPVQLFNLDNNYVLAVTSNAAPGERLPDHPGGDVYRMTAFDADGNFIGLNTNVL